MTGLASSHARRWLVTLVTLVTVVGGVFPIDGALTPASAQTAACPLPNIPAPAESYPQAGAPRGDTSQKPYEIPFSAGLNGGYLEIDNPKALASVVLGGPVVGGKGSIQANACGLVELPQEAGGIPGLPGYGSPLNAYADQYNDNFKFTNPIPIVIYLKGLPLPLVDGYGSADGFLAAQFQKAPAEDGGIEVNFDGTAKSTAVFPAAALLALLGVTAGPAACTVSIGDLRQTLPAADASDLDATQPNPRPGLPPVSPVTGLTYADETTPSVLTTGTSAAYDPLTHALIKAMTGEPVTGALTNSQAKLVSVNFPVGAINPDTPPSPDTPGTQGVAPQSLCTKTIAGLLNGVLGLPSPAGDNTFVAPGSFAVHTSA